MPATEPANDARTHVCGFDREYWDGLWQCRCGAFWQRLDGELLTEMFTDPALRARLRGYQAAIRAGECESLADAVARSTQGKGAFIAERDSSA